MFLCLLHVGKERESGVMDVFTLPEECFPLFSFCDGFFFTSSFNFLMFRSAIGCVDVSSRAAMGYC